MHRIKKFQMGAVANISVPSWTPKVEVNPQSVGIPGVAKGTKGGSKAPKVKGDGLEKFNNVMGSAGMTAGLGALNGITSGLSAGQGTPEQSAVREGLRGAISQMGPIGAAVGAATGIVDAIGSMTGLNLDTVNKASADRLGVSTVGNDIINSLPGVSMLFGAFTPKTMDSQKSHMIGEMTSGYGGSVSDINAAGDLAGKRMLGSTRQANDAIAEANRKNKLMTSIGFDNKLRKNNSYASEIASQNRSQYGGTNAGNVQIGKDGFKVKELDDARAFLKKQTFSKIISGISKFQEGGKMNVIVEGALHAHKHNLEETNPEVAEEVTTKGIPVITTTDNEITQVAEIEGGELILTKEITERIEDFFKDGSEEAMIEAGKLLTEEIIEYTEDLTENLLDKNED